MRVKDESVKTTQGQGQEHSKGPWTYDQDGFIYSGGDGLIVSDPHSSPEIDIDEREANARRIVACVNACERLTQDGVEEVISSFGGFGNLMDQAKACAEERDRLSALNAELVQGIECVANSLAFVLPSLPTKQRPAIQAVEEELRAVLAKAKP